MRDSTSSFCTWASKIWNSRCSFSNCASSSLNLSSSWFISDFRSYKYSKCSLEQLSAVQFKYCPQLVVPCLLRTPKLKVISAVLSQSDKMFKGQRSPVHSLSTINTNILNMYWYCTIVLCTDKLNLLFLSHHYSNTTMRKKPTQRGVLLVKLWYNINYMIWLWY